ncbi:DUF6753 family protein [Microcoleus asticus]|uniref:DUF6753 family protein n=1 Tax=Microcoleus asticus TaxID=2815231 RepID=UPI0030D88BAC
MRSPFLVYIFSGDVYLTHEPTEALRWVSNAERKFDRNLMKWNSDSLVNLECKKDVQRLGVTLEVAGRASTPGFCCMKKLL